MDGGVPPWLEERMFDQRVVLLQGPVTAESATRVSAVLFTLDALGNQPVKLHVNAADGDLTGVFALIDALDLMRSPVHAVATAQVGGAVVGVFAAAHKRLAYRHARFRLAEPRVEQLAGTADQVAAAAGRHLRALDDLVVRVAAVTGQPRNRVEDDLASGRVLSAEEAREYGLVEEIVST
jgi:ATP-dependent Clp protease, protease subunit